MVYIVSCLVSLRVLHENVLGRFCFNLCSAGPLSSKGIEKFRFKFLFAIIKVFHVKFIFLRKKMRLKLKNENELK